MKKQKIALTIEEASEITGIGRNTMRQLVAWNKLPCMRVGRKILIQREVLERFVAANMRSNLRDENDVVAIAK